MNIHGPFIPRIILSPDQLEKLRPAVDLSRIGHQKLQKLKFLSGQIDFTPADLNSAIVLVKPYITVYDDVFLHVLLRSSGSAENRLDSCLDLQNVERLRDIVICAVFKAEDLIHILSLCRQHDNRHIRKLADLPADVHPIHHRKHQIQKNHIVGILLCLLQSFAPVIGRIHFIVVLLKAEANSLYNQLLIVHNQHSGCHLILLRVSRCNSVP